MYLANMGLLIKLPFILYKYRERHSEMKFKKIKTWLEMFGYWLAQLTKNH